MAANFASGFRKLLRALRPPLVASPPTSQQSTTSSSGGSPAQSSKTAPPQNEPFRASELRFKHPTSYSWRFDAGTDVFLAAMQAQAVALCDIDGSDPYVIYISSEEVDSREGRQSLLPSVLVFNARDKSLSQCVLGVRGTYCRKLQ